MKYILYFHSPPSVIGKILCSQLQSSSKHMSTKLRDKSEFCECCKEEVWLLFTEACVFALQWQAEFNICQKQENEVLVSQKNSKTRIVVSFWHEMPFHCREQAVLHDQVSSTYCVDHLHILVEILFISMQGKSNGNNT